MAVLGDYGQMEKTGENYRKELSSKCDGELARSEVG